jgi:hypothetical protein
MRFHILIERLRLKTDVMNWLGWQAGHASYLEVATRWTGGQFMLIAPDVFTGIDRAMYRMPSDYDDGLKTTHRTASEDSNEVLRPFHEQRRRFDMIFVDSFHTYEDSRRDLELTLPLLKSDGVIVVHDCHPVDREAVKPQFRPGEWFGHTYLAFLDFARGHPELEHCVVDTDYGCGILRHRAPAAQGRGNAAVTDDAGFSSAALSAHDYHDWDTYFAHRHEVLNLLSVDEFLRRFRMRPRGFGCRLYHRFEPLVEATGIFDGRSLVRRAWGKLRRVSRRLLGGPHP